MKSHRVGSDAVALYLTPLLRPRRIALRSRNNGFRSRQRTSRLCAQFLQRQPACVAISVWKLPGWKVFQPFLRALRLLMVVRGAALNVADILKRRAKHFFLIFAMRTPKQPIHHCAFVCKALREAIHLLLIAPLAQSPNSRKRTCNHDNDHEFSQGIAQRVRSGIQWLLFWHWLNLHLGLLYYDAKRVRQHINRFAMQRGNFSVKCHIDGLIQKKLYLP